MALDLTVHVIKFWSNRLLLYQTGTQCRDVTKGRNAEVHMVEAEPRRAPSCAS